MGERGEIRVCLVGDEDFEVGGVGELLEELAAMAAGRGGDGEGEEGGLGVEEEVGDEELFGVDGVVEGEARELEVDADEDATGGAGADGGDREVGDWWAGKDLGGGDQGGEEVGDGGEAAGLGQGLGLRCRDYESGLSHFQTRFDFSVSLLFFF